MTPGTTAEKSLSVRPVSSPRESISHSDSVRALAKMSGASDWITGGFLQGLC